MKRNKILFPVAALAVLCAACDDDKMDWGTPEDLMGPAVFLASDASDFVNGHILYVDGGILAYIGKNPLEV